MSTSDNYKIVAKRVSTEISLLNGNTILNSVKGVIPIYTETEAKKFRNILRGAIKDESKKEDRDNFSGRVKESD